MEFFTNGYDNDVWILNGVHLAAFFGINETCLKEEKCVMWYIEFIDAKLHKLILLVIILSSNLTS